MIVVVIDNNIFVSAFLRGGKPRAVIESVGRGRVQMLTTESIMEQLEAVLLRPKFKPDFEAQGLNIQQELSDFRAIARYVTPIVIPETIVRDDEDKQFIECALGGEAQYLISGDKDLTTMGSYRHLPIVTPAAFLLILNPPDNADDK